jgi:hypothetical protein
MGRRTAWELAGDASDNAANVKLPPPFQSPTTREVALCKTRKDEINSRQRSVALRFARGLNWQLIDPALKDCITTELSS